MCNTHLTCFPLMKDSTHRLTMFQEVLLSYRIRFKAMATWEWQLSKHRLCFNLRRKIHVLDDATYRMLIAKSLQFIHTGLHLYSSDASCTAWSHVAAPLPQTLSTSNFQNLQKQLSSESMSTTASYKSKKIIKLYILLCRSTKPHVVLLEQSNTLKVSNF